MDSFSTLSNNIKKRCPELRLREGECMARHTTFRIGGPVRLMAEPQSTQQVLVLLAEARALGITPFFLGNGSNLLVADAGWDGLAIKLSEGATGVTVQDGEIEASGGVLLSKLANFALESGLTGLEFAHGIPGTLGGGARMNAGAYGGELCNVIQEVTCVNLQVEVSVVPASQCDFGYRHSAFSDGTRLILGAKLRLNCGFKDEIRARMDELALQRRSKQPLEYPSAGSTFKRPEGYFAAALIQDAGLKGATIGGAQVSEKHSGFFVNRGGATCDDVCKLVAHVQETVYRQFGVTLEMEMKTLGL